MNKNKNDLLKISKDFCLSCKNEMRKWKDFETEQWTSMCINQKCNQFGITHRTLQNVHAIKFVSGFN
jgi:hypothetical protein